MSGAISMIMAVQQYLDERRKLGFDYGKFDFVVHEGRAVLLDANKTPGRARNLSKIVAAGTANLADGFETLIRRAGQGSIRR